MQPSFNLNNSATFTEVLPGIFGGRAGTSSSEQRRRPSQSDGKTSSVRSAQLLHEKVVFDGGFEFLNVFFTACALFGYSGSTLGISCL